MKEIYMNEKNKKVYAKFADYANRTPQKRYELMLVNLLNKSKNPNRYHRTLAAL